MKTKKAASVVGVALTEEQRSVTEQVGADEPHGWRAFITECSRMGGFTKEQTMMAARARRLLAEADHALTHRATTATAVCGMCNDSGIVGYPPDQYEECPECIKARAATTADQQGDLTQYVDRLAAALEQGTTTDREAFKAICAEVVRLRESAQQGAAQAGGGDGNG